MKKKPGVDTRAIAMQIVRAEAGTITMSYDARQLRGADFTFSADCGRALIRHGTPELHFAQLDLYDETKITRTVVVRYGRERFLERPAQNEAFRADLESRRPSVIPGHFISLFDVARPGPTGAPAVHFDVEVEAMFWTNDRAGLIFLVASGAALHAAAVGAVQKVDVVPALEVTLPTAALLDLLRQWKALAEESA